MSIIFNYQTGEVYIENPDPRAEGTRHEKIYYYKPKDVSIQVARSTVTKMREMYELGKTHRSEEIRKILGV